VALVEEGVEVCLLVGGGRVVGRSFSLGLLLLYQVAGTCHWSVAGQGKVQRRCLNARLRNSIEYSSFLLMISILLPKKLFLLSFTAIFHQSRRPFPL
jgi:hypothetical protein